MNKDGKKFPSRVAEGAVREGRKQGLKLGIIRPKTLWPYPRKAFKKLPETLKGLVTVEMNMMAQMKEDVIIACENKYPVYSAATAQHMPEVDQLVEFAKDIINGNATAEEVF